MTAAETRIWNALTIFITLVTTAVPIIIAYQQFELGGSPRKSVELTTIGPIDPFSDLSTLARGTNLSLSVGQWSYNNILIWQVWLHNKGQSPIVPSDFVEPLRIAVDPPWEIVAIGERSLLGPGPVTFNWKRLGPRTMEAERFLLNPDDRISQTVYLTARIGNSEKLAEVMEKKHESSALRVTARVINLKDFTRPPSLEDQVAAHKTSLVYLSFRDVIVLLVIANAFFYWYARSIERAGIAVFPSTRAFTLLVIFSILSYSTAEVITFYLFGGDPSYERILGRRLLDWRAQWHNWLILAVHVICVAYLYRRARSQDGQRA